MTTALPKPILGARRQFTRRLNSATATDLFKSLTSKQGRNPCFHWSPYLLWNGPPLMKKSPSSPSVDSFDNDKYTGCLVSFVVALIALGAIAYKIIQ